MSEEVNCFVMKIKKMSVNSQLVSSQDLTVMMVLRPWQRHGTIKRPYYRHNGVIFKRKRISALLLCVLLMVCTPLGDYLCVRNMVTAHALVIESAVGYIWELIMSACGVSTSSEDYTRALAGEIESWVRDRQPSSLDMAKTLVGLEMLAQDEIGWGATFDYFGDVLQAAKLYFASQEGYGTDEGIDSITVPDGSRFTWTDSFCCGSGYNPADYGLSQENYLYSFSGSWSGYQINADVFIPADYASDNYKILACSGSFPANRDSISLLIYDTAGDTVIKTAFNTVVEKSRWGTTVIETDKFYSISVPGGAGRFYDYDAVVSALPFPFLAASQLSPASALRWVHDPLIYATYNNWPIGTDGTVWSDTAAVPVVSKPRIQKWAVVVNGPLTVPKDIPAASEVWEAVDAADTPEKMTDALAPVVDIKYEGLNPDIPGNPDVPVNPDVPLDPPADTSLKDLLFGMAGHVASIPGLLTDIKNGILAIPGAVTGFFVIDTAAVAAAQAALLEAFRAKFAALYGLSDIFAFSGSGGTAVPVFTIPVPDFLRVAFPGQDRIVVLDLRPYADYFDLARGIIAAFLWIMFGRWVLEQFDVKFHVG